MNYIHLPAILMFTGGTKPFFGGIAVISGSGGCPNRGNYSKNPLVFRHFPAQKKQLYSIYMDS